MVKIKGEVLGILFWSIQAQNSICENIFFYCDKTYIINKKQETNFRHTHPKKNTDLRSSEQ